MQLTQSGASKVELKDVSATEQIGHSILRTAHGRDLAEVLDEAATCISRPSMTQAKTLNRLNSLRERLATERFQLAVLGQFKRGKSTVLNALLGKSVLPIGVVPITAIPAFVESAPGGTHRGEPAAALKIRVTSERVRGKTPKG